MMSNVESNQFRVPSPIPHGVSPGAKKFHLYRLIVSVYEQLASLRVTAYTHTPTGVSEGTQFEALPPLPQASGVVRSDELLHRQVVILHEQLAALTATTHEHTVAGTAEGAGDLGRIQFEAPSPLPQGVSPSYRDEHLYREIVSLHEQLAAVTAIAHLHTAIGVALPR
jgi:hypothetical protein